MADLAAQKSGQGRGTQDRSVTEAAKTLRASRASTRPEEGATADGGAENDLIRLVRIIARQAAREAFRVFSEALATNAVKDPPPPAPSTRKPAKTSDAGSGRGRPDPSERFLSVAEVAERLGVSEKTVRRKISSGDWPAHRVGRLIRISERVLAVVASSKAEAK